MARVTLLLLLPMLVQILEARPPAKGSGSSAHAGQGVPLQPETNDTSDWNLSLEYNRYLQEVVQVLESDPDFRKKLETFDVEKIRDGSIASELDLVNHQVRSQLDVIKRRELERLRHLAVKQFELRNHIDKKHMKIPQHIELENPSFEIEDLRRLIKSTTKDLDEADLKRRQEFKRYEMEKKFEHDQRLSHIEDELKRQEEETRFKMLDEKHKQHEKVNKPMTKEQLQEVWESQDHMRRQEWDPRTFFAMHDLNGDSFWDEDEVRVLMRHELDKVYDPNAPEDDMKEREEEMERMREYAFQESDVNKDRLISYDEFMTETKKAEFDGNDDWETLDQLHDTPFTDEEFKNYEVQRMREIQGMIQRGVVPDGYPYFGQPPNGGPVHPGLGIPPSGMGNYPNQVHPGMQNMGQPYVGQGQQQMNIQPLRGEQHYAQRAPQFGGAQPQNQFANQAPQYPPLKQPGQQPQNVPQQPAAAPQQRFEQPAQPQPGIPIQQRNPNAVPIQSQNNQQVNPPVPSPNPNNNP